MEFDPNSVNQYIDIIRGFVVEYGMKIIGGVVVLLVGLWVIKGINRTVRKVIDKRNIDPSLAPFFRSLISNLLKVLLAISVMSMIGIEMTSFVAILGAAGLAIGLSLSDTLKNLAGGVMILLLRPFKVGDFIETQGFTGTVKEIQIFHTVLNTVDNKRVILPNGGLADASLINYSAEQQRRVDWVFGIGYGDDLDKAKGLVMDILKNDSRVLKDPEPFVRLGEMADSSVNITTRAWVSTDDFWEVRFDVLEAVFKSFNENGINIPFPQMDVHLKKED